jgi:hypothetical protein
MTPHPHHLAIAVLLAPLAAYSSHLIPSLAPDLQGTSVPERSVAANVLISRANPAVSIRVAAAFKYVGAQRFILRDVADAEQHVFVDAAPAVTPQAVLRMYWIQFERYLPGRGGTYDYSADAPRSEWGWPWRLHIRRFDAPAVIGSDRHQVDEMLRRAGYRVPTVADRVRLVYVPETDRRQELMIIYLEPAAADGGSADAREALLQRALADLHIEAR